MFPVRLASALSPLFSLAAVLAFFTPVVWGQGNGNGNGNGTNTPAGISIDAAGLVRSTVFRREGAAAAQRRRAEYAAAKLTDELRGFTALRTVSLRELERAIDEARAEGGTVADDVRYLAGLQQVDFLFVDTESRDILLGGPAEGFAPDLSGRMRGLTTGRPPLHYEDLIAALRSVWEDRGVIGCSIDPDPGRLADLGRWLQQNSSPAPAAVAGRRYDGMARVLGEQVISIQGVPEDSHLARTLVEADYRMKRIALGVEPSGVKGVRSHLSMLIPGGNSLQRWWFVPLYDPIARSDDGQAFQLSGPRLQLLAQDEVSDASGNRSDAATTRRSTQQFAIQFTERIDDLAEAHPALAELQNIFDLAVVAALLRSEGLPERVGWSMSTLLDAERAPLPSYPTPRRVPSEATHRRANRGLILGLVGGVTLATRPMVSQIQSGGPAAVAAGEARTRVLSSPSSPNGQRFWNNH